MNLNGVRVGHSDELSDGECVLFTEYLMVLWKGRLENRPRRHELPFSVMVVSSRMYDALSVELVRRGMAPSITVETTLSGTTRTYTTGFR